MEENLKRQNCCRLCLAPDSECISIFNSYAADKEPLVTKINNCVSIKPLPAVQIKDEPIDVDEEYNKQHDDTEEIVDPTLFLERTEEEGDEPIMHGGSGYEYDHNRSPPPLSNREAACRACNLKFSTRANARRHERKLHPNLFELTSSTTQKSAITQPTAALAAALELQRVSGNALGSGEDGTHGSTSISTQKYRQEVMNAFSRYETGLFDYDNPEKYQYLLTDEKIVFLQQNEEFLSQYQDMTCRCCQKTHATYKNFMAHMRKKYATLPRNLCFNCLKLNDSKALFISHLKKRNCINLYKVLHALMKNSTFASTVAATIAAAPEKVRAKELLVNKMYECKMCPQHFRLRLDFRTHVYDEHNDAIKKNVTSTQCPFCAVDIEDPVERKRHHNNMDCIVNIRCVTCNSTFDSHQQFMEHAYEKHLNGFGETVATPDTVNFGNIDGFQGKKSTVGVGDTSNTNERRHSGAQGFANTSSSSQKSQYFSRMPQACPICGQQYNNYNNVLRHMESKHPDQLPQTYKCVKCGVGYPRLSNLREHMVAAHAADKSKHTGFEYIVNADAIKITDGNNPNVYTGRYAYVMKDLMSITNGSTNDDDEESAAKKMKMDNSNHMYTNLKECPVCNAVFNNNIGLSNHMRSHTAAAQSAATSARNSSSNSLTITPVSSSGKVMSMSATQQAIFKRSLEQAADRRFRRMRCRICQRRFSSKKSYRFHMLNDHQIRNVQFIKCKLCDAEFAYEKGLKVHMFKIHNTLLKDDMIIKQFECDICSIVYRNEEQLLQHKTTVHNNEEPSGDVDDTLGTEANSPSGGDVSGISTPLSAVAGAGGKADRHSFDNTATSGPLYWYQCKYCPSNFNTNKKLAIHINSHDEFDSNDYSCKDCGNVYSGRKSLWVHRYKKHPQIAEPSECTQCKKIFFDSQMLQNHIPTCNRTPITSSGAVAAETTVSSTALYKHKTGDDDDDEDSRDDVTNDTGMELDASGGLNIKLPEVACTICGQRFTDQELFSKHIQIHEMELYTDNPLAAMFDTGPADPNQFYLDRVNDNGEYACDLCQKTFTQMTAFKVHRKWHFRGDSKQSQQDIEPTTLSMSIPRTQISRQHLQGLQAVGLMPNAHPSAKSQKRKRELKCQYCPSTFISNNNLRRHIYELHKDAVSNLPKPPHIKVDDYLHCRRCNLKFDTKHNWIEHKVADARILKPFGPFQWGCDLCGAYVSRKEKLINHIHNHMKESVITPVVQETEPQAKTSVQQEHRSKSPPPHDIHKSSNAHSETAIMDGENSIDQTHEDKEEYEEEEVIEEVVDDDGMENDGDGEDEMEIPGDGVVEDEDSDEDVGDMDGDYEEIENDYHEANSTAGMLRANESSTDGQHSYEDVEPYEEECEDDEEECEDDVEDTNDDETNDTGKGKIPPFTISVIRNNNSEETSESEDSRSYTGGDDDDDDDDEEEDMDDAAEVDDDDEEEDEEIEGDGDGDGANDIAKPIVTPVRYPCDLCQVYFDSQLDLQKHVKIHFLNGPGSVTLGIKTKTANKSRSSSSDILAVSSS